MAGRDAGGCRSDDGRPRYGGGVETGRGVAWRVRIRLEVQGEWVGGRGATDRRRAGMGSLGGAGDRGRDTTPPGPGGLAGRPPGAGELGEGACNGWGWT